MGNRNRSGRLTHVEGMLDEGVLVLVVRRKPLIDEALRIALGGCLVVGLISCLALSTESTEHQKLSESPVQTSLDKVS